MSGVWEVMRSLLVLVLLTGCSAHHSGRIYEVELEEVEIVAGGPDVMEIADHNDVELFVVGEAAFADQEYEKAGIAFSRLTDVFPESPRLDEAHYNAGLAWERAGEFLWALPHYQILTRYQSGRDWRDAAFRQSETLYHLEDYAAAADLLHEISKDEHLTMNERIEALVKEGVCLVETGNESTAEILLRKALGHYIRESRAGDETIDDYYAAQGQFFLGEIYRLRFERSPLDPSILDLKVLHDDFEHKAGLLLSAQGHYLRAIRLGHARWAAASGFRVGRLYEVLHEQLVNSRLPLSLADPNERLAYADLLREEVRVVLTKSMIAYERTLAAAERIGLQDAWRRRIESSLERVKEMLLQQRTSGDVPDS